MLVSEVRMPQQETKQDWNRKVLQNDHLRIEVLPNLGGKLSSISLAGSGGELLQAPLKPYAPRTATEPFDEADGSGWDECLPSIGPCTVAYGTDKTAKIEDHGDLWRLAWAVDEATDTLLSMHVEATTLPLRFERTLRLDGPTLHLDYSLTNTGDDEVPWGWSVHPLFAIEPFDVIHLPPTVTQITAQASSNGRLGKPETTHPWPHTINALDNQPLDLSLCGSHDDNVGDKLVLPSPSQGWAAIERKTLRTRLTLHFDPQAMPNLGLWLCYGGWPEHPSDPKAKKGYAVGLEPCNLPIDSLAQSLQQGAGAHLAAGATTHWALRLQVTPTEER
jgi:galactose mutarotase-like enzyme